jgi:hypothetical protein
MLTGWIARLARRLRWLRRSHRRRQGCLFERVTGGPCDPPPSLTSEGDSSLQTIKGGRLSSHHLDHCVLGLSLATGVILAEPCPIGFGRLVTTARRLTDEAGGDGRRGGIDSRAKEGQEAISVLATSMHFETTPQTSRKCHECGRCLSWNKPRSHPSERLRSIQGSGRDRPPPCPDLVH